MAEHAAALGAIIHFRLMIIWEQGDVPGAGLALPVEAVL